MKKTAATRASHLIISLLFIALLVPATDAARTAARPRFRSYNEDRPSLDRFVEEAGRQEDRAAFEDLMRRGREVLRAEWERDAGREIERTLLEEGAPEGRREELEAERSEARAAWERDVDGHIADAEGSWYARKRDIAFGELDREKLKEDLAGAKAAADAANWDARITPAIEEIEGAWERALDESLLPARARAGDLPEASRQAYENEISRIERELRARFSLEKNTLVFEARNSFITDRFIDNDSLRKQSEGQSADAVTENIIARVREELEGEEKKLIPREPAEGSGEEKPDLSRLGEGWRQELERLVEGGMGRWREAQELLYREMTAWKAASEEALEAGEAAWRRSYERLYEAKEAWRASIEGEIGEALDRWREKEESLSLNLAQARADFSEYMGALNDQWNAHSYGLREMALTGSSLHGEAVDTVGWLNSMLARYQGTPAFQNDSESLKNIINGETGNRIEQALASVEEIIQRSPFGGSVVWYRQSPAWSIRFLRSEYDQERHRLTEYYRVEVKKLEEQLDFGQYMLDMHYDTTVTAIDSFEWTNVMTQDSPAERKSAWYFYKSELMKWNSIKTEFGEVIAEAENAMHEANMLGLNGPGFLVNAQGEYVPNAGGENDPYLMTSAEADYRRASRERDYWQRRFAIAQAVLDYAGAGADRESADATERARNGAFAAMDAARQDYESRCSQVKDIVNELRSIQGVKPADESSPEMEEYSRSIEYLSSELAKAREELEKENENYLIWKRALIVLENGRDTSFLVDEIKEVEENLLRVDRDIREKSADYYIKSREYERLSRLEGYADLYREAVLSHTRAKQAFAAFSSVVHGTEDDKSLLSWTASLETRKAAIWGDNSVERYASLRALTEDYETASGDEKNAAREKLCGFFRSEYGRLSGDLVTATERLHMLEDRGLDARAFLSDTRPFDTEGYRKAAALNRDSFALILRAMEDVEEAGDEKDHGALLESLGSSLSGLRYAYGEENSEYISRHAAYRWAQANTAALAAGNWDALKEALARGHEAAGAIHEMYESYEDFDPEGLLAAADSGEEVSRRVLREYYARGSMMAMLPFIRECDDWIARSEMRYTALRDFAVKNRERLASCEREMGDTDFRAEILDYVNAKTPGFVLSEESLGDLGIYELSAAAALAEEYLAEKDARGEAVPAVCRDIAARIAMNHERMLECNYLEAHAGEENPGAILESAIARSGATSSALSFLEGARNILFAGGSLEAILEGYGTLEEKARGYLAGLEDASVRELIDDLNVLKNIQFEKEKNRLAAEFVAEGQTLDPDRFISARCGSYTESEREAIRNHLLAYAEKKAFLESDIKGALSDYLDSRKLSGPLRAEMERFGLIERYMKLIETGRGADEPAFSEYLRHHALQQHIASQARREGESDGEYLERIVDLYLAGHVSESGHREEYIDFSGDFLARRRDSRAYLPGEVREHIAANAYYDGVFTQGGFLRTDDEIRAFMDEAFGVEGLSAAVRDSLSAYIGSFSGIDSYYGQEAGAYIESLPGEPLAQFRKYLLLPAQGFPAALRPDFESGVYGLESAALAGVYLSEGMAGLVCVHMKESIAHAVRIVKSDSIERGRLEKFARSLAAWKSNPEAFESYRNRIETLEAEGESGAILLEAKESDGESYLDEIDGVTGRIKTFYFAPESFDGSGMIRSMIIEAANGCSREFESLLKASRREAVDEPAGGAVTIERFIERANGIYDDGANYTCDAEGVFSFEAGLDALVSGVISLASSKKTALACLYNELSAAEASRESSRARIASAGKTLSQMRESNGSLETIRRHLMNAASGHAESEARYEGLQRALAERQDAYKAKNEEYLAAMNDISAVYNEYRDREYEYERAEAVWEYAHTPYLKSDASQDSGLTGNGIVPPDAEQSCRAIEEQYNQAQKAFLEAESKLRSQETLESLLSDTEYAKLRSDFIRKSGSYVRTAQAAAQLGEDIGKSRQEYETRKEAYETARDNSLLFNTDDETSAEKLLRRDILLEHLIGDEGARIEAYMGALPHYLCNLPLDEGIKSELAELETQFNPELFNEMRVLAAQYLIVGQTNIQQAEVFLLALIVKIDSIRGDLRGILAKRTGYEAAGECYGSLHSLKDLSQARDLLKEKYGLTDEESARVFDARTEGPARDGESLNVSGLRRLERRLDLDGNGITAVREGDRICVLRTDGTRSGESFELNDAGISLQDESGNTIAGADASEGTHYRLYDLVYCSGEISCALLERLSAQREEYRAAYERYIAQSAGSGTHDHTVMLRDLESQYWQMISNAIAFGSEKGESRQRSFQGYRTLLHELLSGSGSVHGRIVGALASQNAALQEQEWEHRAQSFEEKKQRWIETVGFIHARGMRDWATSLNDYTNQWMKWRIDARTTIEAGEREYVSRTQKLSRDMRDWGEDAVKVISAESEKRSCLELSERINDCIRLIQRDLPGTVRLEFDTERIMAQALKNRPVPSIGMFASSMGGVSTAMGLSELLRLNLPSSLHARFAQDMDNYETQMSVMQKLRAADTLNAVIEGFNTQLAELNKRAFERVVPDIRARYTGPFARHLAGRMWIIDVVKSVSDSGTRYREMFWTADYQDFKANLSMKPLKGMTGADVDFLRPATLQSLDPQELEIHVRLESDHLSRQIQSVLGAGGSYPTHVSNEYKRLDLWFDHYDGEYRKGEARRKPAWHETETFKYIKLGQELLLPDLVLKGALDTAIGFSEGGFKGAGMAAISAIASAPIEMATADNADAGVSYSDEKGFGFNTRAQGEYYGFKGGFRFNYTQADKASFSTFGGYGRGGMGAELAMNYSHREGFGGSTGVRLASSNQNASLYAGVTYSQKNKFGLQATATIKSGQSSLGAGVEWNRREGFSASMDARVGMFTAGACYNFTKGDVLSARAGVDYGFGDSQSGLKGSAGLGFSYVNGRGYNLSVRNSMSMYTAAESAATGFGGIGLNTAEMIGFSEDGRLVASSSSSSLRIYDENEYDRWLEKQRSINPYNRSAEKTRDDLDTMDKIELAVSGIWESIKGGLSRVAERTGNLLSHGKFASNDSDAVQRARDIEISQRLWENGAMDEMLAINQGKTAGDYAFLGNGGYVVLSLAPALQKEAIASSNERSMSIYDINDALTAALTGGHRTGDLNENMQALCLLNGAKDASELQRMIKDGSVSINDIAGQAGLTWPQMTEFARVLGIAGGLRDGSVFAGRDGYYAGNGQMVAGRWEGSGAINLNPYTGPYISNGVQLPNIATNPATAITLNYDTLIADVNGRVDLLASRDLLIYQQQMALAKIGLIGAAGLAGAELLSPVVSPLVGEAVGALRLGANATRLYQAMGGAQALTKAGLDMAFGGAQGFAGYTINHLDNFNGMDSLAVTLIGAGSALAGNVWGVYSSMPGATLLGREINSAIRYGGTGFIGGGGNIASQISIGNVKSYYKDIAWSSVGWSALISIGGRYIGTSQQTSFPQYWYSSGLAKGSLFVPSVTGGWMINEYWKEWARNKRR